MSSSGVCSIDGEYGARVVSDRIGVVGVAWLGWTAGDEASSRGIDLSSSYDGDLMVSGPSTPGAWGTGVSLSVAGTSLGAGVVRCCSVPSVGLRAQHVWLFWAVDFSWKPCVNTDGRLHAVLGSLLAHALLGRRGPGVPSCNLTLPGFVDGELIVGCRGKPFREWGGNRGDFVSGVRLAVAGVCHW